MKLAFLFIICGVALAQQPWANILAPTSGAGACTVLASGTYAGCGIDWSQSGVPGGIPSATWTQSGSTITATQSPCNNGSGDCTSTIQAALNSCSGNKYVLMGAGTFLISTGLTVGTGCELRGTISGSALATILNGMGASTASVVTLGAPSGGPTHTNATAVSSGATAGSTSIVVASAAGISTSSLMIISELNFWPYVSLSGDNAGCNFCQSVYQWGYNNGETRARVQIVQVTGVSGTTISFSPPLYTDYLHTLPSWAGTTVYGFESFITNGGHYYINTATTSSPYTCTSGGSTPSFSTSGGSVTDGSCTWLDEGTGTTTQPQVIPFTPLAINAGLQNLIIQGNNTGYTSSLLVNVCSGCWIKGVQSNYADEDHIDVFQSYRTEIRNSYLSNTYAHSSGIGDGTIKLAEGSSGTLIINTIMERLSSCIIAESGANGSVAAYNYCFSNFANSSNVQDPGFNTHAAHTQFNLWEGNVTPNIQEQSTFGSQWHNSSFRNWFPEASNVCSPYTGANSTVNCTPAGYPGQGGHNSYFAYQASRGLELAFSSIYMNPIGDIYGSTNAQALVNTGNTAVPQVATIKWPSTRAYDTAIYGLSIGYAGITDSGTFGNDSTNAAATTLLHGFYNNIDGSTTWQTGVTHTLPSSFFLTTRPSDWPLSISWPAIGPDITGAGPGNHISSVTAANAAMNCYLNVMGGSDGGAGSPLSFNPSVCYTLNVGGTIMINNKTAGGVIKQ